MNKRLFKETALGGFVNNPVFVLVLAICPTVGVSNTVVNAFSLGAATAVVLLTVSVVISALRKVIPDRVRLPVYIVIIATLTTLVQMFIYSFLPSLADAIGAYIPLIVVNCIILGRAEAFAGKNKVGYAALDGLSMGIGFIAAIVLLGALREALAALGLTIFSETAGGFIVLGLLMALFNRVMDIYRNVQRTKLYHLPILGEED